MEYNTKREPLTIPEYGRHVQKMIAHATNLTNKEEQQKYYEMARKEREKHMVLYPGWSARDNYGKRKKTKEQIF